MWSKIQNFEIKLDRPDHTFSPGEIITGKAILDISAPKRLRSFKVRFKGLAKVHWTRRTGSGKKRRTKHYSAEEQYFRDDHYMIGLPDGETIELPIGSHVFPFEFCLPHNIPSSFETTHGSIRYTIKAIVDRPWKFDHEKSISFTVETPYDLTQCLTTMSAIEHEESETLCCFPCFMREKVKFNVFLPTNSFTIGEAIEAKISMNNTSKNVNVTKVKLQLEQVLKLHSTTAIKRESNVVQKVKEVRRFGKKDEIALRMQVPSLPYSNMVNCSIIDIDYYLNVIISMSGCHCNIKRKYPIVIGTNSSLNVAERNLTTIPATMPTAPYFPVEYPEPMDTRPLPSLAGDQHYPPAGMPLPLGFFTENPAQAGTSAGSTEKPPPSYDEAMNMNEKH